MACDYRSEFQRDIDFLLIDTVHMIPGEILDFITLLPLLKNESVVVLHDTVFSHLCGYRDKYRCATTLLLSSVVAEKYINYDANRKYKVPNIAAFIVNEETRKYISNIFLSLIVNWNYRVNSSQLLSYRFCIEKYYSKEYLEIFDEAVGMNVDTIAVKNQKYAFPFRSVPSGSSIVLYGAGKVGYSFAEQIANSEDVVIVKWVDKKFNQFPYYIESVNSIFEANFDYLVIAVEKSAIANEIITSLISLGVPENKIIWRNPVQL